MACQKPMIPVERIEGSILLIRGHKVMLDAALAELYGVETKVLNQAVKRNLDRFPEDFMFRLTPREVENLRFHFGTSSLRSQFGDGSIYSVESFVIAGDFWSEPDESCCPQEQRLSWLKSGLDPPMPGDT